MNMDALTALLVILLSLIVTTAMIAISIELYRGRRLRYATIGFWMGTILMIIILLTIIS